MVANPLTKEPRVQLIRASDIKVSRKAANKIRVVTESEKAYRLLDDHAQDCTKSHKTYKTFVECAFRGKAVWVQVGSTGMDSPKYALLAWCNGALTITLWDDPEVAVKRWASLDADACGSCCTNDHEVIDLGEWMHSPFTPEHPRTVNATERRQGREQRVASAYEATVQIYVDELGTSVVTDAVTVESFEQALAKVIAEDWTEYDASLLVPQVRAILNKLQGYKSEAQERRLLIAGRAMPSPVDLRFTTGPGLPSVELAPSSNGEVPVS